MDKILAVTATGADYYCEAPTLYLHEYEVESPSMEMSKTIVGFVASLMLDAKRVARATVRRRHRGDRD